MWFFSGTRYWKYVAIATFLLISDKISLSIFPIKPLKKSWKVKFHGAAIIFKDTLTKNWISPLVYTGSRKRVEVILLDKRKISFYWSNKLIIACYSPAVGKVIANVKVPACSFALEHQFWVPSFSEVAGNENKQE